MGHNGDEEDNPDENGDETDESDDRPVGAVTTLSLDATLGLLANRERRLILDHLRDSTDSTATVGELVEHLLERKAQQTGERPGYDHVMSTLHHVHVPKLVDSGVVEYDPRRQEIRYWGNERLERWHDRIREETPKFPQEDRESSEEREHEESAGEEKDAESVGKGEDKESAGEGEDEESAGEGEDEENDDRREDRERASEGDADDEVGSHDQNTDDAEDGDATEEGDDPTGDRADDADSDEESS